METSTWCLLGTSPLHYENRGHQTSALPVGKQASRFSQPRSALVVRSSTHLSLTPTHGHPVRGKPPLTNAQLSPGCGTATFDPLLSLAVPPHPALSPRETSREIPQGRRPRPVFWPSQKSPFLFIFYPCPAQVLEQQELRAREVSWVQENSYPGISFDVDNGSCISLCVKN